MSKNYELEVQLPTKGILYDGIPGTLNVRNITTKEEKIIFSNNENFMYDVVEECLVKPEKIDVKELVLADMYFLLVQLRIHTYGSVYKIDRDCVHCGHPNSWKIDFSTDFDIYELEDDFEEPLMIELPKSGDELGVKLLRGKDLEDVDKETERKIRNFPEMKGDPSLEIRMKKYIKTINGEEVPEPKVEMYVNEGIHGHDSAYFWDKISKVKLGYDPMIRKKCRSSRCGRTNEFSIPMTPEFFRPSFDD